MKYMFFFAPRITLFSLFRSFPPSARHESAPSAIASLALSIMHRLQVLQGHLAPSYWGRSPSEVAEYRKALLQCREELREFILEELCAPILVRLAWHDSGTYDACVPAS